MVWRVKFQKRIGRSAAKADVTVAASTKTKRAVLRMTLPCWPASLLARFPVDAQTYCAPAARSALVGASGSLVFAGAPFGGRQMRIEPSLDAGSGEDAKLWRICTGLLRPILNPERGCVTIPH